MKSAAADSGFSTQSARFSSSGNRRHGPHGAKLNGALSESNNKTRLFPPCAGEGKAALLLRRGCALAAFVNGYDDTSAKPSRRGCRRRGAGWLGKIGAVCSVGENLFETLMLNLVLLRDRYSAGKMAGPYGNANAESRRAHGDTASRQSAGTAYAQSRGAAETRGAAQSLDTRCSEETASSGKTHSRSR